MERRWFSTSASPCWCSAWRCGPSPRADLRRRRGVRHLWAAAALVWVRLARRRCGADRGRDRQRVDRGPALRGASTRLRPTETATAGEQPGPVLHVAARSRWPCWFLPVLPRLVLLPARAGADARAGGGGAPPGARRRESLSPPCCLPTARSIHCSRRSCCCSRWSASGRLRRTGSGAVHRCCGPIMPPEGELTFAARLLPPVGYRGRHLHPLGRGDCSRRSLPGRAILAAMWLLVMIAGLRATPEISRRLAAADAGRRTGGLSGGRICRVCPAGRFPVLPGGPRQTADHLIEVPVTLSIAAILGLLVAGPPERETRQ